MFSYSFLSPVCTNPTVWVDYDIGVSGSKRTLDALKSAAKYFGSIVSRTNNEKTRAAYDDAIEKLVSFEQSHGIT